MQKIIAPVKVSDYFFAFYFGAYPFFKQFASIIFILGPSHLFVNKETEKQKNSQRIRAISFGSLF